MFSLLEKKYRVLDWKPNPLGEEPCAATIFQRPVIQCKPQGASGYGQAATDGVGLWTVAGTDLSERGSRVALLH